MIIDPFQLRFFLVILFFKRSYAVPLPQPGATAQAQPTYRSNYKTTKTTIKNTYNSAITGNKKARDASYQSNYQQRKERKISSSEYASLDRKAKNQYEADKRKAETNQYEAKKQAKITREKTKIEEKGYSEEKTTSKIQKLREKEAKYEQKVAKRRASDDKKNKEAESFDRYLDKLKASETHKAAKDAQDAHNKEFLDIQEKHKETLMDTEATADLKRLIQKEEVLYSKSSLTDKDSAALEKIQNSKKKLMDEMLQVHFDYNQKRILELSPHSTLDFDNFKNIAKEQGFEKALTILEGKRKSVTDGAKQVLKGDIEKIQRKISEHRKRDPNDPAMKLLKDQLKTAKMKEMVIGQLERWLF